MPLGLGHWWVILIVLAIVLIVYGPGKLPEVGGAVGKAMREFRKASSDLQDEIKRGTTPSETDQASRPATDTKPTSETKS